MVYFLKNRRLFNKDNLLALNKLQPAFNIITIFKIQANLCKYILNAIKIREIDTYGCSYQEPFRRSRRSEAEVHTAKPKTPDNYIRMYPAATVNQFIAVRDWRTPSPI